MIRALASVRTRSGKPLGDRQGFPKGRGVAALPMIFAALGTFVTALMPLAALAALDVPAALSAAPEFAQAASLGAPIPPAQTAPEGKTSEASPTRGKSSSAETSTAQKAVSAVEASQAQAQAGRFEDAGVLLAWRYEPLLEAQGAGLGRLSLHLQDSITQAPLRYRSGQIAASLQRERNALSDNEVNCSDKIRLLATQGIGRRAEVDLNTWRIVTLNTDNSVAFINPFVGLNNAKLESIVELPGTPRAWLHLPERLELWVRTTSPDRLLVIDTHRRRIARSIDLPASAFGATEQGAPVYDRSSSHLLLPLPGLQSVAHLDLGQAQAELRITAAPGIAALHAVATKDGTVVLSTHLDGQVRRWQWFGEGESATPRVVQTWQLAGAAIGVFYSALADRIVAQDDRVLAFLEPGGRVDRPVRLDHTPSRTVLLDEGRYALAVGEARMSLVDLASGELRARSTAPVEIQDLAVTTGFAYAISSARARATLWSLADLRAGRAQPIEVILGTPANSSVNEATQSFEHAAVSPAGTGLLFANAEDAVIYQYAEGMMAPVGSYSNYKRAPLAVAVLDLAPREVAPGEFVATVRHERGGRYELIVSGVGPRFAACDHLALVAPESARSASLDEVVQARLVKVDRLEKNRYRVELNLQMARGEAAPTPLTDLRDLTLLVFDKRSGWQRRAGLRETAPGAGRYAVELSVPRAATYELLVGSASGNLSYLQGRVASLALGGSTTGDTSTATEPGPSSVAAPTFTGPGPRPLAP